MEDIIENALESLEDEGLENEISEEWIREILTKEYVKNAAESENCLYPTDTDKLHTVFDTLCKDKILALHNTGYTQSDAVYDIQNVWKDLEDEGKKPIPIGYCYYHGQDLERVIETGVLCIGFYGGKEGNDKEAIAIGHKIALALKDAGFSIEWNGTTSQRIKIHNFNWQNTFASYEDVEEKWGYDRVFQLM